MNKLVVALTVVVGVLGGFYAGARYGQGHPLPTSASAAATASSGQAAQAGGTQGQAGGRQGAASPGALGGAVSGPIVAVDGDTFTVHDRRTNRDVRVSVAGARITRTIDGTSADLVRDQNVTVVGQAGSDGVVDAQQITLGPAVGAAGGRGRPQPSPS